MSFAADQRRMLPKGSVIMDAIRQYIISVTSAAIVCGVMKGLVKKGPAQEIIKILCGTFLAFTFLNPVMNLSLDNLSDPIMINLEEGRDAIADGVKMSEDASKQEISKRISDAVSKKAAEFGLTLSAEVIFNNEPIPVPIGLKISGAVTPYAKIQLQHFIRNELGINEENLSWIG